MKKRRPTTRRRTPPRPRNPVARALRGLRPKVVPKATAYSRKRAEKPDLEEPDA